MASERSSANALAVVALVAIAVVCQLAGGGADVPIVHADFGATAFISIIASLVSTLFGWFRGTTDSATKYALEGVRGDIKGIGETLTKKILELAVEVAGLLGGVRRLIAKVFGPLYTMLRNLVNKVRNILTKIFGPILDFLDEVRKHIRDFYTYIVRPILDVIAITRAFLGVLAHFDVEWAKKIDAKLAELEGYIALPFEWLTQQLNRIENAIDRILTFDGLFQRVTLLASLMRDGAGVANIVWKTSHQPLSGSKLATYQTGFSRRPVSDALADAEAYFVAGAGPDRNRINEHVADLRLRVSRF